MNNHTIKVYFFLVLLGSITLFSSAHLAYATEPLIVLENTTLTISDTQTHPGLLIETGAELTIAEDGSLTTTGDSAILGTMYIDGVYKHTGNLFLFSDIIIRCGILDPESSFISVGTGEIKTELCDDGFFFDNLIVNAGGPPTIFLPNHLVTLTGETIIRGTLLNLGTIINLSTITLDGGTFRSTGEIIHVCSNFGISKIQGTGTIDIKSEIFETCSPPTAVDDSYLTLEDVTLTVAAPGVLKNDTDVNSSGLTASSLTNPTSGTLDVFLSDGSFTYTPKANFFGTDSFTYQITDGNGGTNTATVRIEVTPDVDGPTANPDPPEGVDYAVSEGSVLNVVAAEGVLVNDEDVDETDSLTAENARNLTSGTLDEFLSDGSFKYTPEENFSGKATF